MHSVKPGPAHFRWALGLTGTGPPPPPGPARSALRISHICASPGLAIGTARSARASKCASVDRHWPSTGPGCLNTSGGRRVDGGGGWAYARPPAKVASSHVTPRWVECISHRVLFSLFGLGSAPEGPLFGKRRNRLKCNPKRHTSRLHPQMQGLLQPLSIRSSLWVPCRALARYRKIGQVRFVTRRKSRTMRATRKIVRELTERRCPKEQQLETDGVTAVTELLV